VGPKADGRELVGDAGIDGWVIAAIERQLDAHCGQELVVRDPLLLGTDDPPGNRELDLLREILWEGGDDAIVLAHEQRVRRCQGDVLVGSHVAGDDGGVGISHEAADELHRWRRRSRAGCARREVVVVGEQLGAVVGRVTIERSDPQPVEALLSAAIDGERVDVRANRVHLLPHRVLTGAPRRGGPGEWDASDVIAELLESIIGVEGNRHLLVVVAPQREGVVEELPPHEPPLAHTALREDVLGAIVEDAVADVPGGRAADRGTDAVGIVRRRHSGIGRPGLASRRVGHVVAETIEAATIEEAFDEISLLAMTRPLWWVGRRRQTGGPKNGGEPGHRQPSRDRDHARHSDPFAALDADVRLPWDAAALKTSAQ
jgi:hypothetical protein